MDEKAERARIAIAVTWTRRRFTITARFGVLAIDPTAVSLLDRDDAELFRRSGADVRVGKVGRTRIQLDPGDGGSFYVAGFTVQQARSRRGRELVSRHHAVATPPRSPLVDERSWQQLTDGTNPYGAGARQVAQHMLWQPLLLGLLWQAGARPMAA